MKFLFLCLVVVLAGCASYETTLKNPTTGATATCDHSAKGIISASMAKDRHDACIGRAKAAGFTEIVYSNR